MNLYLTVPLLTLIAVFQSVLFSQLGFQDAHVELMVMVVLTWSFVRGMEAGAVWAFIGGLLIDLFSGGPLGGTSLALLVVAFLGGLQWGRSLGPTFIRLIIVTALGFLAYHIILLLVLAWTGRPVSWGFSLSRVILPGVLLNGLFAPLFHRLMVWLDRRIRRQGLNLSL